MLKKACEPGVVFMSSGSVRLVRVCGAGLSAVGR